MMRFATALVMPRVASSASASSSGMVKWALSGVPPARRRPADACRQHPADPTRVGVLDEDDSRATRCHIDLCGRGRCLALAASPPRQLEAVLVGGDDLEFLVERVAERARWRRGDPRRLTSDAS